MSQIYDAKTRAARIAQARASIAQGRRYTATKPGSDATPIIRDLCIIAGDLIVELSATQAISVKEIKSAIRIDTDSPSQKGQDKEGRDAPA